MRTPLCVHASIRDSMNRLRIFRLGMLCCLLPLAAVGQAVVVQNTSYTLANSGTTQGDTITANTNVAVVSGATVTYQATTRISLGTGFTAQAGSIFHAIIGGGGGPPGY